MVKTLNYLNDSLSGYSICFNDNGSIYRKLLYKNNELNGKSEFYSSEGELLAKYIYLNNTLYEVNYLVVHSESPPRAHDFVPKICGDYPAKYKYKKTEKKMMMNLCC